MRSLQGSWRRWGPAAGRPWLPLQRHSQSWQSAHRTSGCAGGRCCKHRSHWSGLNTAICPEQQCCKVQSGEHFRGKDKMQPSRKQKMPVPAATRRRTVKIAHTQQFVFLARSCPSSVSHFKRPVKISCTNLFACSQPFRLRSVLQTARTRLQGRCRRRRGRARERCI